MLMIKKNARNAAKRQRLRKEFLYVVSASPRHCVRFLLLSCLLLTFNLAAQNPQLNSARLNQAQTFERVGYFDRAAEIYKQLFESDPRNGIYYQGLKRCLMQVRRYDDLLAVIQGRLTVVDDLSSRIDIGVVYYNQNNQAGAIKHWNDLLKQYPAPGTYANVAASMKDSRAFDEALRVYQDGRKRFGQENLFALELADLHASRLEYEAAADEYLRYLSAEARQLPFVQRRLVELARGSEEAAQQIEKAVSRHLSQTSNTTDMRRLLAVILLENKEYARALAEYQTLDKLAGANNAGAEIFNFAEQVRAAGAWDYAEQAYQLILTNSSKSPYANPAMMGLAECYQQQGKHRLALEALENLISKAGTNVRNPWVLRAMLEQGDIQFTHLKDMAAAIAVYQKIYDTATEPNSKERLDAVFRLGDCHLALGEVAQAVNWYETARRLGGNRPGVGDKVKFALTRLEFYQGRFRNAKNMLEDIVAQPAKGNPEESMVNDALEMLLLIEANFADSAGALRSYAHAEFLNLKQNRRAAIDTLNGLIEKYPNAGILPQAMYNLGLLYSDEGQYSDAVATLQAVTEKHGESMVGDRALFRLAEIHADKMQDYPQAQKLFEKLLETYSNSLYLEEARRRVRSLSEKVRPM